MPVNILASNFVDLDIGRSLNYYIDNSLLVLNQGILNSIEDSLLLILELEKVYSAVFLLLRNATS